MCKRPFILFAFCILFAVLMTMNGCGVSSNVQRDNEDSWRGVITLWDFPRWPDDTGNRFGWIEEKIREFEEANPGVYIHLRRLKWEYGMIEMRAAAAAGAGPDIAPVAADPDFIMKGYLEPVDEYFLPEELAEYDQRAVEAVSHNGQMFGFPWFMTTHGLFVNKEIFNSSSAELPENGLWSYEEFVSVLQKVTQNSAKSDKAKKYGFNIYLSPGSYQVWGFLTMDGARIFDEKGNFALNCPEGVSALSKLVDLEAEYKVVPTKEYGTLEETKVWSDFCEKQRISVYPAGPWAINILKDRYNSGEGFEFDLAHYPRGESTPKPFIQVAGYAILRQDNKDKKDICSQFLKYITSKKEQDVLTKYGVFPVYTDLIEKTTEDYMMKRMKDILDTSINLPKVKGWHKIDEAVIAQIRMALLSKKTPSQALEDMEKTVKAIMANY